MSSGTALVIVPAELEAGYLLAGVRTIVADSTTAAEREVGRLLREGLEGVVALYEPFFTALGPQTQRDADTSLSPVIVPLPSGLGEVRHGARQARLSELLSRAVGYHITFGGEEDQ